MEGSEFRPFSGIPGDPDAPVEGQRVVLKLRGLQGQVQAIVRNGRFHKIYEFIDSASNRRSAETTEAVPMSSVVSWAPTDIR